jgi:hypothetical protein
MLNAARCELIDADESGRDDEVIAQKADLVIECEELIARLKFHPIEPRLLR